MPELKELASLSAIDYRSFDGYLFPGGYEQLWDLGRGRWGPRWSEAGFAGDAPSAVGTRYEPKAEADVSMSSTCRRRAELQ